VWHGECQYSLLLFKGNNVWRLGRQLFKELHLHERITGNQLLAFRQAKHPFAAPANHG
jgi:hypothetical protein